MQTSLVLTIIGAVIALALAARELPKLWRELKLGPNPGENKRRFVFKHRLWLCLFTAAPIVGLVAAIFQTAEVGKSDRESAGLKAQVRKLEADARPRTITPEQMAAFINSTKETPKTPVWIFCSDPNTETQNLIMQTRQMLDQAGFGTRGTNENESLLSTIVETKSGMKMLPGMYMAHGVYKLVALPITARTNIDMIVTVSSREFEHPNPMALGVMQGLMQSKITFALFGMADQADGKVVIIIPGKFGS